MRLFKFVTLLLITAFSVCVAHAHASTIKKNTAYTSVLKVQTDNVFVINPSHLFTQVDEGVLQENIFYRFYKLNDTDPVDLSGKLIILPQRQGYYEQFGVLKSTRSFTNYNRLKRLEIISIPPNSGSLTFS